MLTSSVMSWRNLLLCKKKKLKKSKKSMKIDENTTWGISMKFYDHEINCVRKCFSWYWLHAFNATEILTIRIHECFEINCKQIIKTYKF